MSMKRTLAIFALAVPTWIGCSSGVDSPPVTTATPVEQGEAPPPAPAAEAPGPGRRACIDANGGGRLEVPAGGSATTGTGFTVKFNGTSHDLYDDGTSDLLIHLKFLDGDGQPISGWTPSAFSKPAWVRFGDYCVRLLEGSVEKVVLEIAHLGAPESKPLPPCRVSCCPPELAIPAPDGTIECCFCEGEGSRSPE